MSTVKPVKGDKNDKRCAFTETHKGDHTMDDPDDHWCHGCRYYVCENCSVNLTLMGSHDVMEHRDNPEELDE